ncbi:MAG: carbohydrate ABC transporter permease, partial [Beutenbergiaceae bacterium]
LLLLPWVVPVMVSAMAWNWMIATPNSLIPRMLTSLGMESPAFLADPTLAAILVFAFKIWYSFPFMMMMSSSALAAVDTTVYEASSVDGATKFQQFRNITLPLIRPTTTISCTLMVIFCVNDFPTIFLLTNGGPVNATTTLILLAYQYVFMNNQVGAGTAIAFMTTLLLAVISIVMYRQIRKSSMAE